MRVAVMVMVVPIGGLPNAERLGLILVATRVCRVLSAYHLCVYELPKMLIKRANGQTDIIIVTEDTT